MNLTEHFTLEEMTLSETAARQGIDNTPDAGTIGNLKLIAAALEQIRSLVGKPVNVTSGYRSPAVNRAVGGASNSAHVQGLAADINVPGYTPKALANLIKNSGIPFDQLILEYDRWVHVAVATGKPRGQLLTIRNGTGYLPGIV